jgi:hypothetical protein
LTMVNISREDMGSYALQAENNGGSTFHNFSINVICKIIISLYKIFTYSTYNVDRKIMERRSSIILSLECIWTHIFSGNVDHCQYTIVDINICCMWRHIGLTFLPAIFKIHILRLINNLFFPLVMVNRYRSDI